jgi:hypothetical protein
MWRYSGDGLVWVRVDGSGEFAVHVNRWSDLSERRSIIATERGEQPQPWWGV